MHCKEDFWTFVDLTLKHILLELETWTLLEYRKRYQLPVADTQEDIQTKPAGLCGSNTLVEKQWNTEHYREEILLG